MLYGGGINGLVLEDAQTEIQEISDWVGEKRKQGLRNITDPAPASSPWGRLGRNPSRRRRRPHQRHLPSPLLADVAGQSPPTAGGGGIRSLACASALLSRILPCFNDDP